MNLSSVPVQGLFTGGTQLFQGWQHGFEVFAASVSNPTHARALPLAMSRAVGGPLSNNVDPI